MGEFDGKRALVTGSASGIGKEIATLLAEQGARVMLSDIDGDNLEKVAAELGSPSVKCDVSKSDQVAAAVKATTDAFGGLDILVNNAGIEQIAPLIEHDESGFDLIYSINVKGVWLGMKHGIPAIIASGGGSVVNMASVAGLGAPALFGVYGSTKAACISLTQTAALELRDHGVRVNAVCPAFIATPMVVDRAFPILAPIVQQLFNRPVEQVLGEIQGRLGTPREVADAVAFLASDRASFITGAALTVDNGLTVKLI
jgi:NAD(P)-dependent dehydrogenase (short-subunit alcohol dehydrogenase family)